MSNGPSGVLVTAATADNEPEDEKEQVDGESLASAQEQAAQEPAGRGQGEEAAAETPRRPISPLGRGTRNPGRHYDACLNARTTNGWPCDLGSSAQNDAMVGLK